MHTNRFFILIVDQCLKIHLLDKPHQPLYNGLFNGIYCKPTHLQVACVVWIWRNKFLSGNTNMLRDFEKIAIICLFMLIKKHVFANLKKFSTKSNFQTFCISLYILYRVCLQIWPVFENYFWVEKSLFGHIFKRMLKLDTLLLIY